MDEKQRELWLKTLGETVQAMRISTLGERSQTLLAEKSKITRMMVWKIEQGEVNPSITVLHEIALALGCKVQELLPRS